MRLYAAFICLGEDMWNYI